MLCYRRLAFFVDFLLIENYNFLFDHSTFVKSKQENYTFPSTLFYAVFVCFHILHLLTFNMVTHCLDYTSAVRETTASMLFETGMSDNLYRLCQELSPQATPVCCLLWPCPSNVYVHEFGMGLT